jgi:hypothetical protein
MVLVDLDVLMVVVMMVMMPVGAGALQHKLLPASGGGLDPVSLRHSWRFGGDDFRIARYVTHRGGIVESESCGGFLPLKAPTASDWPSKVRWW